MTEKIPRLNKEHGFLKCIIRNQIERDEYEKALRRTKSSSDEENDPYYRLRERARKKLMKEGILQENVDDFNEDEDILERRMNNLNLEEGIPFVKSKEARKNCEFSERNEAQIMNPSGKEIYLAPHRRLRFVKPKIVEENSNISIQRIQNADNTSTSSSEEINSSEKMPMPYIIPQRKMRFVKLKAEIA